MSSVPSQLSFLPDDYLDLKAQQRTNAICATLFAFLVIGTGAAFQIMEKSMKKVETEYAEASTRYAEAAAPIERFKRMQDQQKRMEAHAALSASLLEKAPRAYLLAEITRSLPNNVSLLDLSLDARPRIAPPNPQATKTIYEQKKAEIEVSRLASMPKIFDVTFKLTGMAENDVQVAAFMNQLAKSRLFRDVNLVVSDEFQLSPKDAKQRKFVIEMLLAPDVEVKPPEAPKTTKVIEASAK
jgi:Tfp pilus assembly protein PilN